MKKLALAIVLMLSPLLAHAQGNAVITQQSGSPVGQDCGFVRIIYDISTSPATPYYCSNGVMTALSAGIGIAGGAAYCGDVTGSTTVKTCTTVPATPFSGSATPTTGSSVILFSSTNGGAAPTLNVNGSGAFGIYYKAGATALAALDILANKPILLTLSAANHWEVSGEAGTTLHSADVPAITSPTDYAPLVYRASAPATIITPASAGTSGWVWTSQGSAAAPIAQALTNTQLPAAARRGGFGGSFGSTDSGAAVLTTGLVRYATVPYKCTIDQIDILISPADTATFKTWKVATGTAIPTVANVISTNGIGISSNTALHSTTVSDFTSTAVAANDIVAVTLTAVGGTATFASYVVGCLKID